MNRAQNKVRKYILAILLLSVYSITCNAQNSFVKSRYTFSVSTRLKKTYVKIKIGDVVQVTASGKMVFHGITGSAGPDGMEGFPDRCMDPVFPYGALLYKVGNDDWVMADPDNPLTADQAGYLKLMVNDNDPFRNRGGFLVKVTVTGSKANDGHQIVNRPVPEKAKDNIAPRPKDNVAPIPNSGVALEKPKDKIAPTPRSVAAPQKAKNNKAPAPNSAGLPGKTKDNIALTPRSTAVPGKAKDNIAPAPHPGAAPDKAKENIAATHNSVVVPEKAKENITPIPRAAAGLLTLPQLQQLSAYSAKAAKALLTSKQFRVDGESDYLTNKYNFINNDIAAYVIKYVNENQATFSTSSAYNYEAIKASLNKYKYTPRELVTKAEGVTKYANSKYSMSIVLSQLNNKPQYLFVVKKL